MNNLSRIIEDKGVKESVKEIYLNKDQILESYKNKYFGDNEIKELAFLRLEICRSCDLKKGIQDNLNSWFCPTGMACSCSLTNKAHNYSSRCLEGKWDELKTFTE
jgi:hypothetical protein